MEPRTPWQALTRGRYVRTGWPWRAVGYLGSGVVTGAIALAVLLLFGVLAVVLVGIPLLLLTALALGGVERRRLRLVDLDPAADPHRVPDAPGLAAWLRVRVREQVTWRELAYAVLHATVLWPLDLLVLAVALGLPAALLSAPLRLALDGQETKVVKAYLVTSYPQAFAAALLGAALLVVLLYPLGAFAGARAALSRALLAPREAELRDRIGEVTASRARLVAAFEAERRRIERDLHDGAQQRLVALTMTLGLARLDAPPGPLADQLAKAHEEAGQVLTELRELIHGIHPQVLADYGLAAALTDAADRSAVPVDTTDIDLPRLPAAVESAGYFAVCEALANIGRHSGATRARISARHAASLTIEVEDDGRGGATASISGSAAGSAGTGLTGLADRLAVLDGTLTIISPAGGPTLLRVEIPCPALPDRSASSSQRTASSSAKG
ncbi:sensor histidine kinase [Streptomyces vilmorinianum]|uniref:sensor histidine kinase n=1 Tax=Streptomyces vilmorinianum TaxID=3051092 RepID=UPI0010FB5CD1|nr:sensor histidine kinase [Streptomyces vilmorinianum]